MRAVVVGASSGLGRCIGAGLAQRGAQVALPARRRERLDRAAREAGSGAIAIECDVTDADSCRAAITAAAGATTSTTGTSAGASGGKNNATTAGGGFHKGMAVFTIAKGGLMYQAAVGGQKFSYKPKGG